MTREEIKEELIERYIYLYINAECILAPFMHEQTQEEYEKAKQEYPLITAPISYLQKLDRDTLLSLEDFLLSDKPMKKSSFYNNLESNKTKSEYLEQVSNGLKLLESNNRKAASKIFHKNLDLWTLLTEVRNFILEQSGDLKNKNLKLAALDEYFRINRYSNDGAVWTSGYHITLHDMQYVTSYVPETEMLFPSRNKDDIGVKSNAFIKKIASDIYLTEGEKQQIYLKFHDELPWDLLIECHLEEPYDDDFQKCRLIRPDHTKPCHEEFNIVETDIFVDTIDSHYRYYQLCPNCGYMVNIPKEILSDGIRERIEERCKEYPNLFRRQYLHSEMIALDNADKKIKVKRRSQK